MKGNQKKKEKRVKEKKAKKQKSTEMVDEFSTSWSEEEALLDAYGRVKKTYKGYPFLKKVLKFYKPHWLFLAISCFVAIIVAGLGLLTPIFSKSLMEGFTNFNPNIIIRFAVYVFIVDASLFLIEFISSYILFKVQKKVSLSIKRELLESMTRLSTRNFDKTNSGKLINLVNQDAEELSGIGGEIISLVAQILGRLGFLAYAFYLNIWLGLMIIAEMIFMYVIESFRIKQRYIDRTQYKKLRDKGTGIIGEIIRGIRDIRLLNLKREVIKKSDMAQKDMLNQNMKTHVHRQIYIRVLWVGQSAFELSFLVLTTFLILWGQTSVAAALTLWIFKGRVINLMSWIVGIKEYLKDGELSASRIYKILDGYRYGYEKFGRNLINNCAGKIEFKNVKFAYEEDKPVMKDISFTIEPNTTVAIVGESGEGKSTALNLINRMYDKLSGDIFIDGERIETLTEDCLRGIVTTVSQDPYIFNMTIKENLLIVNPNATQIEIETACKQAMIHDFINSQTEKYKTNVGENGIMLSGGQKQRLAIARALLKKNSKIILFDEATSSLDNDNQEKIKEVISNLDDTHTVVIVAHRLSTIMDCKKIIVIRKGKVFAEGTHRQLMRNCPSYKKLYRQEENV